MKRAKRFGNRRHAGRTKTKPKSKTTMPPTESKKSVKETQELLIFLTLVSKFIADKSKGGFKKHELFAAIPLIDDAMGAFAGIDQVPAELADLDDEEAATLATETKKVLANLYPDDADKFDKWIDCAFDLVGPISRLVAAIKA